MREMRREQFEFEAIFRRVCETEKNRHRSVQMIQDISGNPALVDDSFLASHGFGSMRFIEWNWSDEDDAAYGAMQTMPKGGFVKTARADGNEKLFNFVFLRCEGVDANDHGDIDKYSSLTGIVFHEMGHVDDIEKEKFLKVGERVDLVGAEEYAHRYALKRMMKENLRFQLGLLMGNILKTANGSPSIAKEVAKRVVESGEFRNYREFVGTLVDIETCAGVR